MNLEARKPEIEGLEGTGPAAGTSSLRGAHAPRVLVTAPRGHQVSIRMTSPDRKYPFLRDLLSEQDSAGPIDKLDLLSYQRPKMKTTRALYDSPVPGEIV